MLRKKNFLVVTILILLVFLVTGCNLFPRPTKGIISGRVLMPPSGKELSRDVSGWVPAANATVTIVDASGVTHTVITDANGYYTFENIAVKANTVVTAKVKVDGKTMVLKTVIDKAVKEDGEYDSGKMTPESTALALVVENLVKEGKVIDLEEIKKASSFDDLVKKVNDVLEEHGNVINDDDVEGLIDEVKDEVTTTTTALTAVGIDGERIVGETLTAYVTPTGATVTYQWMRSDTAAGTYTNISGATGKTYKLLTADKDKYIKVKATGTGNYTGTVTSAAVGPILTPITGVAITGEAVVGKTLTAAVTPSAATVTYQWMRSDTAAGTYTNITDATGKSYNLIEEDKDKYIKVEAKGTGNYTGTKISDAKGPVLKVIKGIEVQPRTGSANGTNIIVGEVTPGADREYSVGVSWEKLDFVVGSSNTPHPGYWFGLQLLPEGVDDIKVLQYKTSIHTTEWHDFTEADVTEAGASGQIVWWIDGSDDREQVILLKYEGEDDDTAIKLTVNFVPYELATISMVDADEGVSGSTGWTRLAGKVEVAEGVESINAYYIFEIAGLDEAPQYWDDIENWKNFADEGNGKYRFGDANGFDLAAVDGVTTEFQVKIESDITVKAYLVNTNTKGTISNVFEEPVVANPVEQG